ncbi:ABC transporter permease subunit [Luteococcus peritonei]|uniref:Maltose/maltodextrin transport system permease protein n=1 Tax=Luteococcus peritonei TaxID=88874 RepID=A0ABW4RTF6_9ACTN
MSNSTSTPSAPERERAVRRAQATYSAGPLPWIIKIVVLGALDAFLLLGAFTAFAHGAWWILAGIITLLVLLNAIYLPPNRMLPAKYLFPGLVFLCIFSLGVIAYTFYISFTNYGDGHNSSKPDAVAAIQANNTTRVPGSTAYRSAVATKDGKLQLVVLDPQTKKVLAAPDGGVLADVEGAETTSIGGIKSVPGYEVLSFAQVTARTQEIAGLKVKVDEDPESGFIRTTTGSAAYLYKSTMRYDEAADTFTDAKGVVYHDNGRGAFVADTGQRIEPGWKVGVGLENFRRAFTSPDIRAPFLRVTLWTFAFAFLSVLSTFALGLFLAIMFNEPRMRGQKVYRVLMILPYAFPGFLSALVWAGLFNQEFGFINEVLLNGARIPWLTHPLWAKAAVLLVNLWLGFPYMFLVATGALQSIPDEVLEASTVDGASTWQTFRQIKLPLLMVPLAPLLISSFAFNFNNFVLIYMLTGGGPQFEGTSLNVGATDLLISMVFKVAGFGGGNHDYGLASAFSIIIFVIIGGISYLGFRQTKTLENLN